MKKLLLILFLLTVGYSANFYVHPLGTAAKVDAIGPVTDPDACMSIITHNASSYNAGDSVLYADSTYRIASGSVLVFPSDSVVYKSFNKHGAIINSSIDVTHGSNYHWHASDSTNCFYLTNAADGDPGIAAEPANLWVDSIRFKPDTMSGFSDRQFDYGDWDGLGFSTVYIKRVWEGNPSVDSALIEIPVSTMFAFNSSSNLNGVVLDGFVFTNGNTYLSQCTGIDTGWIIKNCIFKKSNALLNINRFSDFRFDNCTFREQYLRNLPALTIGTTTDYGDLNFNSCVFTDIYNDVMAINTQSVVNITVTNSSYYGIGNTVAYIPSAGQANVFLNNNSFLSCQYRGVGDPNVIKNASSSGATIEIRSSFLPPAVQDPTGDVFTTGCSDSGGIVYTGLSGITKHRRKTWYVYTNDDTPNFKRLRDSLSLYAESLSVSLTQALNRTNHNDQYSNDAFWDTVDVWRSRGHCISIHTRNHFACNSTHSFDIQYTGAEACSLTIDTAAKTLTTVVEGEPGRNLSFDLTHGDYYNFYGVDTIIARINNETYYSCSVVSTYSRSSMYDSLAQIILLAHDEKRDISTAQYSVPYNVRKTLEFEIVGCVRDVFNGCGCTMHTIIWPAGESSETAFQVCSDSGIVVGRAVAPFIPGGDFGNVYLQRPFAITSIDETDSSSIVNSVYPMVEGCSFLGEICFFYEHMQLTKTNTYKKIIDAVSYMQGIGLVESSGYDSVSLKYKEHIRLSDDSIQYVSEWYDSTDLQLLSTSQLLTAGDTSLISGITNLYSMNGIQLTDGSGNVMVDTLFIGAYGDDQDTIQKCFINIVQ